MPSVTAPPAPSPTIAEVALLAVECDGVSFRYPRPHTSTGDTAPALQNITLSVRAGERLGILGPNGGGKSTLVKLMLGLLKPQIGRLRIFGEEPGAARREGLIGYVPQRIEAELAFPISVRQAVAMSAERGLRPWQSMDPARQRALDDALHLAGITQIADRPIGKLSGGQLQRAMIARALAGRPRVLVLDEPTVGIDVAGQQRFAELLNTLHTTLGLTLIIVSHDIRVIAAGCDRVACLSRTLHFHDAPKGLTPKVLAEVFSHDVAGIFGDVHIAAHSAAECPAACDQGHRGPVAAEAARAWNGAGTVPGLPKGRP